jgi:hypothetical protein
MPRTDIELARQCKAVYANYGCWTWFDDYLWPEQESFAAWMPERDVTRPDLRTLLVTMLPGVPLPPASRWRRLVERLRG